MVELVVTLLIIGILAIAVVPRLFTTSVFESRGFYDQVLTSIQYAQKVAVAQRRVVYVNLDATAGQLALCYNNPFPTACSGANRVPTPFGEVPFTITAPTDVTLSPSTTFFFDAIGRPYAANDSVPTDSSATSTFSTLSITIGGGEATRTITVERESGYVR